MTITEEPVAPCRWSRFVGIAAQLAFHGTLLAIWEIACRTVINPLFLPPPSAIAVAFWETIQSGELLRQLSQTLLVLATGFGLAVVSGMALGITMGTVRFVGKLFDPYVNAFYAMPTVALVPLVVIWLGLDFEAKVFLTWIVGVFPIVISAQAGVQNIPATYIETARAFACSRSQMFFKVMLPAAIPFFVAGAAAGAGTRTGRRRGGGNVHRAVGPWLYGRLLWQHLQDRVVVRAHHHACGVEHHHHRADPQGRTPHFPVDRSVVSFAA